MPADIQPFFLDSATGRIFCLYFPPRAGEDNGTDLLFFPPFAEELNKSRRMIALQARALSRLGFGVLIPDLYGTGDSEGDFADGRWEGWLDDAMAALNWLESRGRRNVIFWGLRLGALLAMATVRHRGADPTKMIFWNPVSNGATYLTQFLRLRLAADMMVSNTPVTTDSLKQELIAGRNVEIAGYMLNPHLASAIEALNLAALSPSPKIDVAWLEIVSAPERPLTHVSRQVMDRWRRENVNVKAVAVPGDAFWNTTEITQVPNLIDATVQQLV